MSRLSQALPWIALVAVVAVFVGCAPKSPEEVVAEKRQYSKAEVVGFFVQPPPEPEPLEMVEGEDGEAVAAPVEEAAAETAEGEIEELEIEPAGPVLSDIMIDMVVQHENREALPGLTVDVTMVDGAQNEKASWKVYLDTSDVPKSTQRSYSHLLTGVEYEEGDGFHAEVRHPVPPEERGEYQEFAAAN